jgi:hypothetical protein
MHCYDVAVVGSGTGAAVTLALVARRGLRAVAIGAGELPPSYSYRGYPMRRALRSRSSTDGPAFERVASELGVRRGSETVRPAASSVVSVLGPGLRSSIGGPIRTYGEASRCEIDQDRFRSLLAGFYGPPGSDSPAAPWTWFDDPDEFRHAIDEVSTRHGADLRLSRKLASVSGGSGGWTLTLDDDSSVRASALVFGTTRAKASRILGGVVARGDEGSAKWRRLAVVSVVVPSRAIPRAVGRDALLLGGPPMLCAIFGEGADTSTLAVASPVDEAGAPTVGNVREAVLRRLEETMPFVERHLKVVDSVHDGRPLWDQLDGGRVEVERQDLLREVGSRAAEGPILVPLRAEAASAPPDGLGPWYVGPDIRPSWDGSGEIGCAVDAAQGLTQALGSSLFGKWVRR